MPSHYLYELEVKKNAKIVGVSSVGAGLTGILIGASLPIIGGVIGLIASAYMIARNSKINKKTTEDYFLNSKKDDTLEVACKYDWLNDQYKAKLPKHLSLDDFGDKLDEYMKKNPKSKIGIKNEEENSDKYSLYDITNKAVICGLLSSPKYIEKLRQKYEEDSSEILATESKPVPANSEILEVKKDSAVQEDAKPSADVPLPKPQETLSTQQAEKPEEKEKPKIDESPIQDAETAVINKKNEEEPVKSGIMEDEPANLEDLMADLELSLSC